MAKEEEIRKLVREEMKAKNSPGRPIGVTIIAILGIIFSFLMVFAGLAGFFLSDAIGADAFGGLGSLLSLVSVMALVIRVVGIIASVFLLKMKKIGMILVVIVGILSIIMSVLQFSTNNLISIIIWAIIIAYLFKKKDLFA